MSAIVPAKLYKYRDTGTNSESIFTKQELYFANPMEFNDPFDCGFHILCQGEHNQRVIAASAFKTARTVHPEWSLEQAHEAAEQAGAVITTDHLGKVTSIFKSKLSSDTNQRAGILSLAERCDDILMWSHYADCHKGICVEFRTDGDSSMFSGAKPVVYSDDYPHLDLRDIVESKKTRAAAAWMLTKSSQWSYEKEWRVLDFEVGPGVHTFPANSLSSVILGCRIPDVEREKVLKWTESFSHPVAVLQAKQSASQFRLEMETVR